MEKLNETKANILKELTCITRPCYVAWLTGDLVAVSGSNGGSVCNYFTNQEVKKICDVSGNKIPWLIDHPSRQMIAFSNLNNHVTVYNVETETIWTKKSKSNNPCIFDPHRENSDMIDTYMSGGSVCSSPLPKNIGLLAFHPTKPLCLIEYSRKPKEHTIETCSCSGGTLQEKQIFHRNKHPYLCCYSFDGSLIAIQNFVGFYEISYQPSICILDLETNTEQNLPCGSNEFDVCSIIFHPTSFILAALSVSPSFAIYYWDTKNHRLITTTQLGENPEKKLYYGRRIDFSNDGKKIIAVTDSQCFILEVPYEVIHKDITPSREILIYWMLKQYQQNHTSNIPNELIDMLTKTVIECSKYSFINY